MPLDTKSQGKHGQGRLIRFNLRGTINRTELVLFAAGADAMIRITRLTDYGIVLLTYVATRPEGRIHNVPDLAAEANLPLPTVGKILKVLARKGLLVSHRGAKGGYSLSRPPAEITLAQIVAALDGPIAITECSSDPHNRCEIMLTCPARSNLQRINQAVLTALENITLAEMTRPLPQDITFMQRRPAGPREIEATILCHS